jgi:hypothetical protein
MKITELLTQARQAGFTLTRAVGTLHIRGPRNHEQLAQALIARKPEVLTAISADPRADVLPTAIDPTEPTAPCPACGFPTVTPAGEDPSLCTRCIAQGVLAELLEIRHISPCARCRTRCTRYGDSSSPFCPACQQDVPAPGGVAKEGTP